MKQSQVTTTKVEVPLQITTKGPKKIAAGKELAELNHRRKEELAQEAKAQESKTNLSYGVGTVIAVGAISLLG